MGLGNYLQLPIAGLLTILIISQTRFKLECIRASDSRACSYMAGTQRPKTEEC